MADWRRRVAVAVAVAGALGLGGCESPLGAPGASGDVLAGQWTACLNDGTGDHLTAMVFYPDASYLVANRTFSTTDRTCGGAQTSARYSSWAYTLGKTVAVTLPPAGTTVTARQIDIVNAVQRIYSIVYEDASATPHVLYFGDLTADAALDGSSAAARPQVLSTSTALSAY